MSICFYYDFIMVLLWFYYGFNLTIISRYTKTKNQKDNEVESLCCYHGGWEFLD